jgi:hypothetical protein
MRDVFLCIVFVFGAAAAMGLLAAAAFMLLLG